MHRPVNPFLCVDWYIIFIDMDYYSQLGEVGIVLLAAKQNILVIQILEVALKLQTMQVNRASDYAGK